MAEVLLIVEGVFIMVFCPLLVLLRRDWRCTLRSTMAFLQGGGAWGVLGKTALASSTSLAVAAAASMSWRVYLGVLRMLLCVVGLVVVGPVVLASLELVARG